MALGAENDPKTIDTSFCKSVARHFWHVVSHPTTTPSLYPNMADFIDEITPALNDLSEGDHFKFSSDPDERVFVYWTDTQTEDSYFRQVWPTRGSAIRLPKQRTASSLFGFGEAKKRVGKFIEESNPFRYFSEFEDQPSRERP